VQLFFDSGRKNHEQGRFYRFRHDGFAHGRTYSQGQPALYDHDTKPPSAELLQQGADGCASGKYNAPNGLLTHVTWFEIGVKTTKVLVCSVSLITNAYLLTAIDSTS
jgi:hypothetical protein